MRKIIVSLLTLASVNAFGQSKLDLGSHARLRSAEITRTADGRMRVSSQASSSTLRAFITLAEGFTPDCLTDMGVTVHSARGHFVVAEFDRSLLPILEAAGEVKAINLEKPVSAKLDRARSISGIDRIHSGEGLPKAYTGKGVVAGIVDGGFDPNHLNFKNPDGSTRIQSFCFFRPTQTGDRVEQILTADEIHVVDTEDATNFHGTHTLGIMAGSYRGKVKAGVMNRMTSTVNEIDNPYYGAAYESDIAIACGAPSDYYVAMGIESILNYSYYRKAPAVVNLSLGSNLGPHDGTSALCQYIDEVTKNDRVIVCIAAGNEGALPISINKTLRGDDDPLLTCFDLEQPEPDYPNIRAGQTHIYSDSDKPFVVQAVVINKSRGRVAFRMPLGETEGAMQYWATSAEFNQGDDIVSPQLGKWFKGYVGVGAMHDSASGRYYAVIDCMLWDNIDSNPDGNYALGLQVNGYEGQRIDVYGDGQFNRFTSFGMDGFTDGSTDNTINDLATGKSTVVVGAYNTRERWASVDNNIYGFDTGIVPEGSISYFSSYGTLIDGRTLPHVCAPGTTLVSSSNEYYLDEAGATDRDLQATTRADNRQYSWHQCAGTSMATPIVSGSIATWLEANPELTTAEVIDIISTTSISDDAVTSPTGNPVQWGAGKFDAYAGLKEALARSTGILTTTSDSSRLMVTPVGPRSYEVYLAGASSIHATVYNTAGSSVLNTMAQGSQATVDVSTLLPGIYILSVNNQSTRIAIR